MMRTAPKPSAERLRERPLLGSPEWPLMAASGRKRRSRRRSPTSAWLSRTGGEAAIRSSALKWLAAADPSAREGVGV